MTQSFAKDSSVLVRSSGKIRFS